MQGKDLASAFSGLHLCVEEAAEVYVQLAQTGSFLIDLLVLH